MSERFSKTGLSSGASWSLFAENTAFEESDAVTDKGECNAEATLLHNEDKYDFGMCPSRAFLQLVICKICHKLVLASAIQRHHDNKHPKLLSSVKPAPPKRCVPCAWVQSPKTQSPQIPVVPKAKLIKTCSNGKNFIRLEEIVDLSDANVKIEEVPLTIPRFHSSAASPKVKLPKISIKNMASDAKPKVCRFTSEKKRSPISPAGLTLGAGLIKNPGKKLPSLKEKEYDVDRHCGVWISETEQNCTRSLTCKIHPLSLRRHVPGRSKDFDVLLAEHKARVLARGQDASSNTSSSPHSSSRNPTPGSSPFGFDKVAFPSRTISSPSSKVEASASFGQISPQEHSTSIATDGASKVSPLFSQATYVDCLSDGASDSSNLPTLSHHPRPLKVNSFGGRRTDCHCAVFSRKMDHFRRAALAMCNRYSDSALNSASLLDAVPGVVFDPGLGHALTLSQAINVPGTRPSLQDPLQNGIVHKLKPRSSKSAGVKRQLSENVAALPPDFRYGGASKRRHSSDVLAASEVFSLANVSSVKPEFAVSEPFARAKLVGRGSCANAVANAAISAGPSSVCSQNLLMNTVNLGASSLNSSLNLCQAMGIVSVEAAPLPVARPSLQETYLIAEAQQQQQPGKVTVAPNVTITQGMVGLLPAAALQAQSIGPQSQSANSQAHQQNLYAMGLKNLVSQPNLNRTTLTQVLTTPGNLVKGQGLQNSPVSFLHNGIGPSPPPPGKPFSVTFSTSQSLTQSGTVATNSSACGSLTLTPQQYKRPTGGGTSQQVFVQQSAQSALLRDSASAGAYKQQTQPPSQGVPTQSPLRPQSTTMQTLQSPPSAGAMLTTPGQSFLNSPHPSVQSTQLGKQLKQAQVQPSPQQHLSQQQFLPITMQHAIQQQILPKIPAATPNVSPFVNPAYQAGPTSVQFISPANAPLQQQRGGTLS